MSNNQDIKKAQENKILKWVNITSIAIPLVVGLLFGVKIDNVDFSFLPPIYASINFMTGLCLIAAIIAIKNKKIKTHQMFINIAMVCSLLFLVGYVAYHITSESTEYQGAYPIPYYILLISHIILSIAVIPFVLRTYIKGYLGLVVDHKKFAKITFPLWLYVAFSGVAVYLMISPYY